MRARSVCSIQGTSHGRPGQTGGAEKTCLWNRRIISNAENTWHPQWNSSQQEQRHRIQSTVLKKAGMWTKFQKKVFLKKLIPVYVVGFLKVQGQLLRKFLCLMLHLLNVYLNDTSPFFIRNPSQSYNLYKIMPMSKDYLLNPHDFHPKNLNSAWKCLQYESSSTLPMKSPIWQNGMTTGSCPRVPKNRKVLTM